MTPEQNYRSVNAFMGGYKSIIVKNHGFVNQYLATPSCPFFRKTPGCPDAAIEMRRQALRTYNVERHANWRQSGSALTTAAP